MSDWRFVQAPTQKSGVVAFGHLQAPFAHVSAAGHGLPQAPQLLMLLERSAQNPLQLVWLARQPLAHADDPLSASAHTGVVPVQLTPHAPQFELEVNGAHPKPASLQSPKPEAHVYEQRRPSHEIPASSTYGSRVQSLPQAPQL